ncbi:hypothetical protein R6242_02610 [Iodobacter sp. CM08]|uniref:hypothetical protein n=1 Tax=Iodobacter sp. CM08 TaxID=3085902 RepID=UPI0029820C22|nr:hypothetical protein [Iodobacter sp. CM08]MDW5415460.1 hypothetical protein [Iodobacter sp. CM08]
MQRVFNQRGAIALMLLMVVGLGIAAAVLSRFSHHIFELRREQQTLNALQQAKQILLADALAKRGGALVRPGEFYCPDRNVQGEAGYGQSGLGLATPSCPSNQPATHIGRIPWATYHAEELRDSSGEPLWMAVADGFQERITLPLNSDTAPQAPNPWFLAAANSGAQALSSASDPIVVVILAPGPALAGQNRSTAAQQRNPSNYFECNRQTVGGACLGAPNNYANNSATLGRFLDGPRLDSSGNPTLNDRVLTIRRSELIGPLEQRAAKEYQQLFDLWARQVGSKRLLPIPSNPLDVGLPFPAKPDDVGCTQTGAVSLLPSACAPNPAICRGRPPRSVELTGVGLAASPLYLVNPINMPASIASLANWQSLLLEYDWLYRNRWEQVFFYALANTPSCALPAMQLLNMQLPSDMAGVEAVLMSAGVAQTGQLRSTVLERASLSNYLDLATSAIAPPPFVSSINRSAWDLLPLPSNRYAKMQATDVGNDALYYRYTSSALPATSKWLYAPKDRP